MTEAVLRFLGRRPYREVLALQRTLHAAVAAGSEPDTWLTVEHDPVVTLGRNASARNLRLTPEVLAERGVDCVSIERGGDVTYHGPGQLVVYPIVRLSRFREIVPFVTALEAAIVRALATLGVVAHARREHRGVYVGDRAIAAIGLSVKQMTTLHGLALNVTTALDYDTLIVPCGEPAFGITSIVREAGHAVTLDAAREALAASLATQLDLRFSSPRPGVALA